MNIKTVCVIKHPIESVWFTMRDELPNLINLLEDIESITVQLYKNKNSAITEVVNVWAASPKLPKVLSKKLDPKMFIWTDYAKWNNDKLECVWRIVPHHFSDKANCAGSTKFENALGGRGTKVTFSGNIDWNNQNHAGLSGILEDAVRKGIEVFVQSLIPKNFRKITGAVSTHLDSTS